MTGPLRIRGVAEAHEGPPWSWAARERLLRYAGELNFTHYLYAPGGDPLVRQRWWEPYLPDEVELLVDMAQVGARRGVAFCPGLHVPEADAGVVLAKLWPLYNAGIRAFALLGLAADGGAGVVDLLVERMPGVNLLAEAFPGTALPAGVVVLIKPGRSRTLIADMETAGRRFGRPPVLWDSYPGSAATGELPLRPVRGRDAVLAQAVAGFVAPCHPLPEVSRVALHTWAAYLRNPSGYDPERAWVQALAHVAPEQAPALRLLGELTRGAQEQPPVVLDPAEFWQREDRVAAIREWTGRFESWDRAAEALRELPDKPLRDDLRPWVAKLGASADAALKALKLLTLSGPAAERFRGQVLSALWRLREHPANVAGDQVERFVRDCLRA